MGESTLRKESDMRLLQEERRLAQYLQSEVSTREGNDAKIARSLQREAAMRAENDRRLLAEEQQLARNLQREAALVDALGDALNGLTNVQQRMRDDGRVVPDQARVMADE